MSRSNFVAQLDRLGPFASIQTLQELLADAPECPEALQLETYISARSETATFSEAMVAAR